MWDTIEKNYGLVMTVRQARKLAEVLLDETVVVRLFADEDKEDA
jgi:hypothetical protein